MAKRFETMNMSTKKLKLDLSVQPSDFSTNTSDIADLWGSDDDDFILLATQIEEKNERQPDGSRHKSNKLSFSQFLPQSIDNASTQQRFGDSITTSRECSLPMSHQPPSVRSDEMLRSTLTSKLSMEEMLRTDKTIALLPELDEVHKELDIYGINQWGDYSNGQATANRRQLAQERQLKFLMERVDVLKKENTKLQKDIINRNNQTVTKEGEVSLLRNELRQVRKMLQASKVDRIIMAEEAEKDCNKKVAEVFKQVIAKNAELNFTNVEFSEHKIRGSRNTFKGNPVSADSDTDVIRDMLRIENLYITSSYAKLYSDKSKKHFYEYSKETRPQKKQRSFFEVELEHLLFHYEQLQSQLSCNEAIIERLIMSVFGVFTEFWSYAQSLDLPQHCMMYPYSHFDLQLDDSISKRFSLIQPETLYNLERAVLLRRYIATLALICQKKCNLSQALLEKKHGNYSVLHLAIQAITKLSYSIKICEHFGVIEATGAFLHSLLGHVIGAKVSIDESQQDLLFNLLKQLVFTRPNPWVFRELSYCMLLCVRQDHLMARMCKSSKNNCFVSDRVRSLYRFGPESCLIQVYAGLLELCFCNDNPLKPNHFNLLLSICGNHVRFVYHCFISMPGFILKMLPLPSFADEEKSDKERILSKVVGSQSDIIPSHRASATANSAALSSTNLSELTSVLPQDQVLHNQACECYVKLCLSVVTLVFQMMYHWTLQEKKTHISQVGEISQIAVHLLILIFREYYLPSLFRDSEETTKHNLSLLCTWWTDQKLILNFEDTHVLFLNQLQELQFMLKPLHQETNLTNPDNDLAEWTRIVKNADANIRKYDSPEVQFNSDTIFTRKTNNFFNSLKTTAYNFE